MHLDTFCLDLLFLPVSVLIVLDYSFIYLRRATEDAYSGKKKPLSRFPTIVDLKNKVFSLF